MSVPYTSVSVSGYNADPPSDDGSATAGNQLKWQNSKEKLGDPLKTAIEAIDANVLAAFGLIFGQGVRSVAASDSVAVSDRGNFIVVTATATISLPAAATAGEGFPVVIVNQTTNALVTIDANSSETINGEVTVYLGPGESIALTCDGASWTGMLAGRFPNRTQTKSGNYDPDAYDNRSLIEFTAAATANLPAAATAGSDFRLMVFNSSSGLVTLDPNSSETINGATTLVLDAGESAILVCSGSSWTALVVGGGQEQHKVKTADQAISGVALADDDHMAGYVLQANEYYKIHGFWRVTTTVSADFACAFVFTDAPQEFAVVTSGGSTSTPGAIITFVVAATELYISVHGFIRANASTGGTVKLRVAQGSAVDATSILEGSWMNIERIGRP